MVPPSSDPSDDDAQKAKDTHEFLKKLLQKEDADYARAGALVDRLIKAGNYQSTWERYQSERIQIQSKQLPEPTPCEHLAILLEWKAIIAAHLDPDSDAAVQFVLDSSVFHRDHSIGNLVNLEQLVPILAHSVYRHGGPPRRHDAIATYMVGYNHPATSEEWKKAHQSTLDRWINEFRAAEEKLDEEIKELEREEMTEKNVQKQKQRQGSKEMNSEIPDRDEDNIEVKEIFHDSRKDEDLFGKKFENVYSFTHCDGIIDSCESVAMLGLGEEVKVSLVKPAVMQLPLFESLIYLCNSHRNLLTIFHVARDDTAHVEGPHLLTEKVSTIEEYFKRKLMSLQSKLDTPLTIKIWWSYIENEFQCIFRDVIQGLLHLYFKCQRGCGHITFNTFITHHGEGRILPSINDNQKNGYNSKDVEDDSKELTTLMKHVIIFPFVNGVKRSEEANLAVNLPSELVHFFTFTCKYKPGVPPYFWLDHPYFWPVLHRVNFAYKLSRISKRDDWKYFFATKLIQNLKV